jgi:hypothetical protein
VNPDPSVSEAFGFTFKGARVDAGKYGRRYVQEFQRVLHSFAAHDVKAMLEWGGGLTTQILAAHAEALGTVELLLTIDNKPEYQKAIFAERPRPAFLKEIVLDLTGPCQSRRDPELAYSTYPLGLERKFDFIFIDGRRRMECAFIAAMLCHERTVVAIHDYHRARYQPVRALFDVVEDGSEFRVMRPRPAVLAAIAVR